MSNPVYLTFADGTPVSVNNPLPVLIMTSPQIQAGAQGTENTSGDLNNGYFQWKLNDTTGLNVQDGLTPPIQPGGIVGSVNPSCDVLSAPGKIDKSFHFSSISNWVYLNDIWGYIAFNSQMGFTFWYKCPAGPGQQTVCYNTSDSSGATAYNQSDGWGCRIDNQALFVDGFDDQMGNVGGGGIVSLQDGQWHLIGCYWDGASSVQLWVDNGIDYGNWSVGVKPQLREHFFLGNTAAYNQDFYIDDFRAWGAVLTQSKMQQLYNLQPQVNYKTEITIPTGVNVNNIPGVVNTTVTNFPSTQGIVGNVSINSMPNVTISNFPATQPVSGTITVSNLANPMPVTGSFTAPAIQDVNIKKVHGVELTSESLLVKRKYDDW